MRSLCPPLKIGQYAVTHWMRHLKQVKPDKHWLKVFSLLTQMDISNTTMRKRKNFVAGHCSSILSFEGRVSLPAAIPAALLLSDLSSDGDQQGRQSDRDECVRHQEAPLRPQSSDSVPHGPEHHQPPNGHQQGSQPGIVTHSSFLVNFKLPV